MTSTITNGNGVEPDANAAALEALEAEAKRAGIRLPRRGEEYAKYILVVARAKAQLGPDEHVADEPAMAKRYLDSARHDEFYGNTPAGRALITAAAVYARMNPDVRGVGELGPSSRRGIRSPIAMLLRELIDDPTRAQRLGAAERDLLDTYADDALVNAIGALGPLIDAAYARIRDAAEAELARPHYDAVRPTPPQPLPEAVPLGTGTSRSSLQRIVSASDLRENPHGL